ncbi:arylamine N-acetyltransferase family protein [Streptomyces minutiscleroticus]|uniref:Acetyltransferase n=1 Tax=Streptomyces minutiscleroticus TaxID=68238 RepID=A0A918P3G8_9ACTN|nr:arylamine N-acetyltransferase [Streptomyces minutiscleroticus]GGY17144.1 acetyltransferase [Streptomyces minutiscleroticus]
MFNIDVYLKALEYDGPREPTVDTLRELHKRHLMTVPYDSSLNSGRGTSLWAGVDIDHDATFDAVVTGGRGGVCYELNGLFSALLRGLGYPTGVFAAGIRQADGAFGPDMEHVFGFARVGDDVWLTDVGFVGPSYLEPLRLAVDEVTTQYGTDFRIVRDGGYHVVQRKGRSGGWQAVYRFRPEPREYADWGVPSPELERFARQLSGAGIVVRGRAFERGQRILIGKRLVTVDDGHERMRGVVDPGDHARVLAEILRRPTEAS